MEPTTIPSMAPTHAPTLSPTYAKFSETDIWIITYIVLFFGCGILSLLQLLGILFNADRVQAQVCLSLDIQYI